MPFNTSHDLPIDDKDLPPLQTYSFSRFNLAKFTLRLLVGMGVLGLFYLLLSRLRSKEQTATSTTYNKAALADNHLITPGEKQLDSSSKLEKFQSLDVLNDYQPVGPEIMVATGNRTNPKIASLSNGRFIVVYQESTQLNSTFSALTGFHGVRIWANLYNAEGKPIGSEMRIDTDKPDYQIVKEIPELAVITDDGKGGGKSSFVIAWQQNLSPNNNRLQMFVKRFNAANGEKYEDEFQANIYSQGYNVFPGISALTDSSFIIAWQNLRIEFFDQWGIYVRRYTKQGIPIASDRDEEFRVGNGTSSKLAVSSPKIASFKKGGYAIIWEIAVRDPKIADIEGIYARFYFANHTAMGEPYRVSPNTQQDRKYYKGIQIAVLKDDSLVITWLEQRNSSPSNCCDVYATRYFLNDTAIVLPTVSDRLAEPSTSIAALEDGGFLITWIEKAVPKRLYLQRYTVDGNLAGESEVTSSNNTIAVAITPFKNNGYAVVWQKQFINQLGYSDNAIYVQRYEVYNSASTVIANIPFVIGSLAAAGGILMLGLTSGALCFMKRQSIQRALAKRGWVKPSASSRISSLTLPFLSFELMSSSFIVPYEELHDDNLTRLGGGSYGTVYKTKWHYTDVAIKQLHVKTLDDDTVEDFKREAEMMVQMTHPNIIRLYGVCVDPGHYSLVMEYMPKGSLYQFLHSRQEISWPIRWSIALDIGKGIYHLHSKNILHRDLKSLNVLLDENFRAKLCDFGMSLIRTETSRQTNNSATDEATGTVSWMAPELFNGQKYTQKADVYSYGMILWEIAARKAPYEDFENGRLIKLHVEEGKRETMPEKTPISYARLIAKCWDKRREDRPTIQAVIEELEVNSDEIRNYSL
jgi:tRNA A-37 threonylcarbamoyl transferase component Bud32